MDKHQWNLPGMRGRAPEYRCETDVSEGLEAVALAEMRARLGRLARFSSTVAEGAGVVAFTYDGDLRILLKLQTVQAVYLLEHFAVARPKALLGDQHFRRLLALCETVLSLHPGGTCKTLVINAAGSDSSVMVRLKNELAQRLGLSAGADEGDLLLRLRPTPTHAQAGDGGGWDALVRLTPRPLATRAWRVCNYEGALNGAVAHAIVRLTRPDARDAFLNIACGSGTLLIERLAAGPARQVIGCDIDPRALACAQRNIDAAGATGRVALCSADARALPLPDHSADALCADLPFGHLVGSHADNVHSYPLILREAARIARPGARFGLITHEARLMEQLLADTGNPWRVQQVLRVELGGLHPRIFVLTRREKDV
ncbi:MAG: methyltransferase domain-containing protein [Chloroflexi bacterium]|nr:methyltransferase domain-containing protein [Chloroflexota bacterium]MCL5275552.1 methyltransferase domain-containing protein [Chloroflexota bacterium]